MRGHTEEEYIEALIKAGGVQKLAADMLGVTQSTVSYRIKRSSTLKKLFRDTRGHRYKHLLDRTNLESQWDDIRRSRLDQIKSWPTTRINIKKDTGMKAPAVGKFITVCLSKGEIVRFRHGLYIRPGTPYTCPLCAAEHENPVPW